MESNSSKSKIRPVKITQFNVLLHTKSWLHKLEKTFDEAPSTHKRRYQAGICTLFVINLTCVSCRLARQRQ